MPAPRLCTVGLPRYSATASRPSPPSGAAGGARSRRRPGIQLHFGPGGVGALARADDRPAEAVRIGVQLLQGRPLGADEEPRLNTSSRSPRMRTTSSPLVVISSPHVASHSGQVRKWVCVSAASAGRRRCRSRVVPLGGVPVILPPEPCDRAPVACRELAEPVRGQARDGGPSGVIGTLTTLGRSGPGKLVCEWLTVPLPTRPSSLNPQQRAWPWAGATHTCSSPTVTPLTSAAPATGVGSGRGVKVPSPTGPPPRRPRSRRSARRT